MSLISYTNIVDGTGIDASDVNNPFNTIYNDYNGGITAANLASGAVTTTKITDANVTPAKWTNPYKFSAHIASSQTVSASTATKVALATEDFDTNSNFDNSVGFYRYTAPVTGFYQFNGGVQNNGNNTLQIFLYKNGSLQTTGGTAEIASGFSGVIVSQLLSLTAADYIELFVLSDNTTVSIGYLSGFLVSQT